MTPTQIIAFLAVVLLAVLVGFTIPTLLQVRKTMQALEEFVRGVAPRIEAAATNLDSVLGRVDRVTKGVEDGARGIGGAMEAVGSFLSHLRAPAAAGAGVSSWLAALLALLSGLWQTYTVVTSAPPAHAATAEGGKASE